MGIKKNEKDINWKKDYDLKVKWSMYWSGIKIARTRQILVKFMSSRMKIT